MLTNLADVAAHFSAEPTDESLSRRLYKTTECGAWAKVITRPKVESRPETWTVRYAKVDGFWMVVSCSRGDTPVNWAAAPKEVRAFFWPDASATNDYLSEAFPYASDHTHTEVIPVSYVTGEENVFVVGSIVEGTDAEYATEVALPAPAEKIEAAVADVEAWAEEVWFNAFGKEDDPTL